MSVRVLIALSAALLVAADDEAVTKERKQFQGAWDIISITKDGKKIAKDQIGPQHQIFGGPKYKHVIEDYVEEGNFEINPSVEPKTIDFVIEKGNDIGQTQLGIYKFENGRLIICLQRPGSKNRPKDFESAPGSGLSLVGFHLVDREGK